MTEPKPPLCSYLGHVNDRATVRPAPDANHRCYAIQPVGEPSAAYQTDFCLAERHTDCPFFRAGTVREAAQIEASQREARPALVLPLVLLVALAVVVAAVYGRDLLRPPSPTPAAAAAAPRVAAARTATPSATVRPRPSPGITATVEPGGRMLTVSPKAGDAGWWTSGEARGNHLGDSFLYAGYAQGQAFVAAARIELGAVPRGAAIRAGTLRLSGINADRFNPGEAATWTVQLLPANAVADYARAGFQEIFNAPAAVTLFPTFFPADLGMGTVNEAALDATALAWLEQQVLEAPAGSTPGVIVRITGPGNGESLFAWDSGAGPATTGEGPDLTLELGPAPATPPPLPTEAVIIATETATPANVLTVAAEAWTATAVAETTGTPTPLTYRYVTPTPSPANLATVQAQALLQGLPPIVPHTPTPFNEATATADAVYATAVAFLTGTPPARRTDAVTPYYVTETPTPANVLTAAARSLTATARPPTGTPLPYNAIVVTPFRYVIVTATPPPANQATAVWATAVAIVNGTATPLPYNWVVFTPTPAPTNTPTNTPTAEPTAGPDGQRTAPVSALLTPNAPVADCPDPRAQLRAPAPGSVISGEVMLVGTAAGENFQAYAIVWARGVLPATGYTEAFRAATPVNEAPMGAFVTTSLPNGVYTVRLITLAGEQPYPSCRVVVEIRN